MENLSHENKFDLHENFTCGRNSFSYEWFARRVTNCKGPHTISVLTQREKATRKWPPTDYIYIFSQVRRRSIGVRLQAQKEGQRL